MSMSEYNARILVQVTIYRRLLVGRDGPRYITRSCLDAMRGEKPIYISAEVSEIGFIC